MTIRRHGLVKGSVFFSLYHPVGIANLRSFASRYVLSGTPSRKPKGTSGRRRTMEKGAERGYRRDRTEAESNETTQEARHFNKVITVGRKITFSTMLHHGRLRFNFP